MAEGVRFPQQFSECFGAMEREDGARSRMRIELVTEEGLCACRFVVKWENAIGREKVRKAFAVVA
jgi:hypothetical protein